MKIHLEKIITNSKFPEKKIGICRFRINENTNLCFICLNRLHKERVKRHHEDQSQAYPPPQGGLPMVPIPPQRSQYANEDHNAYRVSDILDENHENRNDFNGPAMFGLF